jgi:16S rRNA processing protein RimM
VCACSSTYLTDERRVPVGRVGRPHGRDGSFYVEGASHPLPEGLGVTVGGRSSTIERRAGTDSRPLVRLAGIDGGEVRGEALLAAAEDAPLEEGEYLATDLVGCEIAGVGRVRRVIAAPSCDLLEVSDDVLIPFVSDAVRSVDLERRTIEVDRNFLGLE